MNDSEPKGIFETAKPYLKRLAMALLIGIIAFSLVAVTPVAAGYLAGIAFGHSQGQLLFALAGIYVGFRAALDVSKIADPIMDKFAPLPSSN